MDAIVNAGWRLSLERRVVRRYAVAAVLLLGATAAAGMALAAGSPLLQAIAFLGAPFVGFALIAAAFRAAVLELCGDDPRFAPDARDVLRRAIVRSAEVLVVSVRALRRADARTPLASPIVVVNGVSADEAARTSQALVAHRWGPGTVVTSGLLFGALYGLPVMIVDALVAVAWSTGSAPTRRRARRKPWSRTAGGRAPLSRVACCSARCMACRS